MPASGSTSAALHLERAPALTPAPTPAPTRLLPLPGTCSSPHSPARLKPLIHPPRQYPPPLPPRSLTHPLPPRPPLARGVPRARARPRRLACHRSPAQFARIRRGAAEHAAHGGAEARAPSETRARSARRFKLRRTVATLPSALKPKPKPRGRARAAGQPARASPARAPPAGPTPGPHARPNRRNHPYRAREPFEGAKSPGVAPRVFGSD